MINPLSLQKVFKHLEERLHPQTVAIQNSYSSVLLSDLQRLYSASIQALSSFVNEKDNMIAKLTEEGQKLDELIGEAQKMKSVTFTEFSNLKVYLIIIFLSYAQSEIQLLSFEEIWKALKRSIL